MSSRNRVSAVSSMMIFIGISLRSQVMMTISNNRISNRIVVNTSLIIDLIRNFASVNVGLSGRVIVVVFTELRILSEIAVSSGMIRMS